MSEGVIDWDKIESRDCPQCGDKMPKCCYKCAEHLLTEIFGDNSGYESLKQACRDLIDACDDYDNEAMTTPLTRKQALEQVVYCIGSMVCLDARPPAHADPQASKTKD